MSVFLTVYVRMHGRIGALVQLCAVAVVRMCAHILLTASASVSASGADANDGSTTGAGKGAGVLLCVCVCVLSSAAISISKEGPRVRLPMVHASVPEQRRVAETWEKGNGSLSSRRIWQEARCERQRRLDQVDGVAGRKGAIARVTTTTQGVGAKAVREVQQVRAKELHFLAEASADSRRCNGGME